MHSATILIEENTKLHTVNHYRKRKKQQRRQYIATKGTLQAQESRLRVAEAKRVVQKGDQAQTSQVRQRVPLTCSNCYVQGHNRRQCTSS